MTTRCVFVYGTLRQGEQRDINRLMPAPLYVGEGRVHGVLYDLGDYPGVLLGDARRGTVCGEVYQISAELERILDEIEEVWPQATGEYRKREAVVQLDPGGLRDPSLMQMAEVQCLVYEVSAARAKGRPLILSGDWVRRF